MDSGILYQFTFTKGTLMCIGYLTCSGDLVGEFGTLLVEFDIFGGPDFLAQVPR